MIELDLKVQDKGLIETYTDIAEHAQEFVDAVVIRSHYELEPWIYQDFSREPGEVVTPIKFTSPFQRKFVMGRKRAGLMDKKYSRKHLISESWRVEVVFEAGSLAYFTVRNVNPDWIFVEGSRQQEYLRVTGWLYAPALAVKWVPIVTDKISDNLIEAFDDGRYR